jgi:DNA polymerase III alpha subunit
VILARLTAKELQEAKRAKQEVQDVMARKRSEEKDLASRQKTRLEQVSSVAKALYDEMDKLNKKAPKVPISELSLQKVNKLIKSAKELMKDEDDEFVQDIGEFIPAGNNPEYRDVVLVLGQVKAGLDRFGQSLGKRLRELEGW